MVLGTTGGTKFSLLKNFKSALAKTVSREAMIVAVRMATSILEEASPVMVNLLILNRLEIFWGDEKKIFLRGGKKKN
jgi:hypothetical protein